MSVFQNKRSQNSFNSWNKLQLTVIIDKTRINLNILNIFFFFLLIKGLKNLFLSLLSSQCRLPHFRKALKTTQQTFWLPRRPQFHRPLCPFSFRPFIFPFLKPSYLPRRPHFHHPLRPFPIHPLNFTSVFPSLKSSKTLIFHCNYPLISFRPSS